MKRAPITLAEAEALGRLVYAGKLEDRARESLAIARRMKWQHAPYRGWVRRAKYFARSARQMRAGRMA